MNKIHFILITTGLLIQITIFKSIAQKLTPPPTKIELPADTSKVDPESDTKIEADKSELELPEVLVLGKDKQFRETGIKKNVSPESPYILQPGSAYEPISIWFTREAEKPLMKHQLKTLQQSGWAQVHGGSYTTIIADVGYWQKFKSGNWRVRGWLDRDRGEFKNSDHSYGGLTARANYELAPKVTGAMYGFYNKYQQGLHGATLENLKRDVNYGGFGADLIYDVAKLSDGRLGFELGGLTLKNDTSQTTISQSNDFWYQFEGSYTINWQSIQWSVGGSYLRETFKMESDSNSFKTSLGQIELETLIPFSSKFTAVLGSSLQATNSDSMTRQSRASPFARINFIPSNRMGITALLHTGYKYDTYTDRWNKNPYIMSRIPLLPRDTQLGVRLETDIELLQNMKLNLGVEREWIDLYQYWERNSNRGYIDLKTIEDVVLTEVKAGITLDINNWTRLETAFIGYSDKLETNNLVENMNQIPYRPQFRIPIRLNLQLLKDMHFTTIANILGERSTSLGGEKSLPAFGLLRASINKEFGHITAVLSVNNLLDSDYTIWEKYPENGITVLGGLIAKF